MRFEHVLVDKDGLSREYCEHRTEALRELHRIEGERQGATHGWTLVVYGSDGNEVGEPQWAEDLLTEPVPPDEGTFTLIDGEVGLWVVPAAATSGTAMSNRRGSDCQPSGAIQTLDYAEA